MILFLIMISSISIASDKVCEKNKTFVNEGDDYCIRFPQERKICISGHEHLDTAEYDQFKLNTTLAATAQDPKIKAQAVAQIKKLLADKNTKSILQGYFLQIGEIAVIDKSKHPTTRMFVEVDQRFLEIQRRLQEQYFDPKGRFSLANSKDFTPSELKDMEVLAAGPYLYAEKHSMRPGSPKVMPSEDESFLGENSPSHLDPTQNFELRNINIARNLNEQCQKKETCYWVGGSYHVESIVNELIKLCQKPYEKRSATKSEDQLK